MTSDYTYNGKLLRTIDGDTVEILLEKTFSLDIDFGFFVKDKMELKKSAIVTFRLLGINAPESKGPSREVGKKSKDYLDSLLREKNIVVNSYKQDKYGRWLAELFVDGVNINKLMLESGYAQKY